MTSNRQLSAKLKVQVFRGDLWHCRYCGKPVFFGPTLKLLDELNPNHGYNHPHGSYKVMLKSFAQFCASVDHVKPVSKEGDNRPENLVTACWACNPSKSNEELGSGKFTLRSPEEHYAKVEIKNWDGLAGLYPKLLKANDEWTKALAENEKPTE